MSNRKFASITGSLLTRKGEAGPSPATPASAPRDLTPDAWIDMPRLPVPATPDRTLAAAPHRLTFRLDGERHRRLSIAAARLQLPMQHLLATALDRYLAALCESELKDCACLKKEGCCRDADTPERVQAKWMPVRRPDTRQNNTSERDGDSTKSHPALERGEDIRRPA